jgi:hypothetical protein
MTSARLQRFLIYRIQIKWEWIRALATFLQSVLFLKAVFVPGREDGGQGVIRSCHFIR